MAGNTPKPEWVPLARLVRDPGLQMRAALPDGLTDPLTVDRYQEAMEDGHVFPPLEVVSDGETYWLFDGFQRAAALERAGKGSAECLVFSGTRADALLRAVAANARHGLTRTPGDCRRALTTLLDAPDLLARTLAPAKDHGGVHRALAAACGVSKGLVYKVLDERNLHAVNGRLVNRRSPAAQMIEDDEPERPRSPRAADRSASPSRSPDEAAAAGARAGAEHASPEPSPLADLQRARNAVTALWTACRKLLDGPFAADLLRCAARHTIPFTRETEPTVPLAVSSSLTLLSASAWWGALSRIEAVLSDLTAAVSTEPEPEEDP